MRSDSPWAVVAGAVKSLGVSVEEALYGISFANLILYGACMPMYGDEENEERVVDAGKAGSREEILDFFK